MKKKYSKFIKQNTIILFNCFKYKEIVDRPSCRFPIISLDVCTGR